MGKKSQKVYLKKGDKCVGPVLITQVKKMASEGEIDRSALLCPEENGKPSNKWVKAGNLKELSFPKQNSSEPTIRASNDAKTPPPLTHEKSKPVGRRVLVAGIDNKIIYGALGVVALLVIAALVFVLNYESQGDKIARVIRNAELQLKNGSPKKAKSILLKYDDLDSIEIEKTLSKVEDAINTQRTKVEDAINTQRKEDIERSARIAKQNLENEKRRKKIAAKPKNLVTFRSGSDPRKSFEDLIKALNSNIRKGTLNRPEFFEKHRYNIDASNGKGGQNYYTRDSWIYEIISYDIQATNSLVTPLEGVINIKEYEFGENWDEDEGGEQAARSTLPADIPLSRTSRTYNLVARYGWKNGEWVLTSGNFGRKSEGRAWFPVNEIYRVGPKSERLEFD